MAYRVTAGPLQSARFDARTQTERYGGHTDRVQGEIRVDWAHPTEGAAGRLEVSTAALATGNGTRDSNMRRAFLETARYPTAVFTLTKIDAPPGAVAPGQSVRGFAEGQFTLHGVTRTVRPAVLVARAADGRSLHLIANFVVSLRDYKINTPRFLFFSVRQEHPITVDIVGVPSGQ